MNITVKKANDIIEKTYCKICNKRMTARDSSFNVYQICLTCLEKDKLASVTEQIKKRGNCLRY